MSTNSRRSMEGDGDVDRRRFLRTAGTSVAVGTLLWASPTVQTTLPAWAATGSAGSGGSGGGSTASSGNASSSGSSGNPGGSGAGGGQGPSGFESLPPDSGASVRGRAGAGVGTPVGSSGAEVALDTAAAHPLEVGHAGGAGTRPGGSNGGSGVDPRALFALGAGAVGTGAAVRRVRRARGASSAEAAAGGEDGSAPAP